MKLLYRLILLPLILCGCCIVAQAQIFQGTSPSSELEVISMPLQDNKALLQAEESRRSPGLAPKFAENISVDINPSNSGVWEKIGEQEIWRVKIESKGAKSLNLGFTTYAMPENGTMIIYDIQEQLIQGPFSTSDNEAHKELWTPIIQSDKIIIEVVIPAGSKEKLGLQLSFVNHDFLGFGQLASGSCNLDVICGIDEGWEIVEQYRDIIRSVAVIGTGGSQFCTGFLINNANNDETPYFMTAFHCGINAGNAASLITYWNFENSTCRAPGSGASGGNGNGSLSTFNTGATYRAGWNNTDFVLVEMDDPIHPDASGYMAGYSLDIEPSVDTTICVHHPSGDEKRISFEFDDTHLGAWGQGAAVVPNGDHIVVPDWDIGTTEPGSSGSPLFDKNKRVIGQLHGGLAACGNDDYDTYGWFAASWEGGGTPDTRLRDWLDPNNVVTTGIDGLDLDFSIVANPSNVEFCIGEDVVITLTANQNFTGPIALTITSGPPAGVTAEFGTASLDPAGVTTLTLSNTSAFGTGSHIIQVAGTDGVNSVLTTINLTTFDGEPVLSTLVAPENEADGLSTIVELNWIAQNDAELYDYQLSSDESFTNIISNETDLSGNSIQTTTLEVLTTYYWRVRAVNTCGSGDWSESFSFTTGLILCELNDYDDDPVIISSGNGDVYPTMISITEGGDISQVIVRDLDVEHTYVGDLRIELTSPEGTTIVLVDRMGNGGCDQNDLMLTFNDLAVNTAGDLQGSCEAPLAAQGEFQPVDLLSNFIGESAAGIWTLTVFDEASQDGGQINGYVLEICSAVPNLTDLVALPSEITACVGEEVSFELFVGTAYTNAVNISEQQLGGNTAVYSQNPADPGSTINVTLQLDPTLAPGTYNYMLSGDDGVDQGTGEVQITIIEAAAEFGLLSPVDAAIGQAPLVDFTWAASEGATSYTLSIFEDGSTDPIETISVTSNSATVSLELSSDYTWTVTASNQCGEFVSETYSFSTIGDLSFIPSIQSAEACVSEVINFSIALGDGFETPTELTISGQPSNPFTIDFDPNGIVPGEDINISVTAPLTVSPGSYALTFMVNDGVNSTQTQVIINIIGAPLSFDLLSPINSEFVFGSFNLEWAPSAFASSYEIEIATDEDFNNIIAQFTTSQTTFGYNNEDEGDYFWRVTSSNDCGMPFISAIEQFVIFTVGTFNIEDAAVNIFPNPFQDQLIIESTDLNDTELKWTILDIMGRRITTGKTNNKAVISTTDLLPGTYFLRLEIEDKIFVDKLVKI